MALRPVGILRRRRAFKAPGWALSLQPGWLSDGLFARHFSELSQDKQKESKSEFCWKSWIQKREANLNELVDFTVLPKTIDQ